MDDSLLKEKHKFFKDCSLIVQAPGSFFWTGEHSVMFGYPALIQPIALTVTVGVESVKSNQNCFDFDFRFPNSHAPIYTEIIGPSSYYKPDRLNEIEKLLKILEEWKASRGYSDYRKFQVWCDIPSRTGLNSSGAISVCMSILLYAMENGYEDNEEELAKIVDTLIHMEYPDLLNSQQFIDIFRLSWLFDDLFHNNSSSGAGPFSSFLATSKDGGELLLYCSARKGYGSSYPIRRTTKEFEAGLEELKEIPIFVKRLKIPESFKDNYALSIIYSGTDKGTGSVLADLEKWLIMSPESVWPIFRCEGLQNNEFYNAVISSSTWNDILIQSKNTEDPDKYPRSAYSICLGMISLRIMENLLSEDYRSLMELIRENNYLLKVYGVYHPALWDLEISIYGLIVENGEKAARPKGAIGLPLAIKLTGAGGGGNLLVFGKWNEIQKVNKKFASSQASEEIKFQLHYSTLQKGWFGKHAKILLQDNPIRSGPVVKDISKVESFDISIEYGDSPVVYIMRNRIKELCRPNLYYAMFLNLAARRLRANVPEEKGLANKLDALQNGDRFWNTDHLRDILGRHGVGSILRPNHDEYGEIKRDHKLYLDIDPRKIRIDKSVERFRSIHLERLGRLVDKCRGKTGDWKFWEKYHENLAKYIDAVYRSEELVKDALTILGFQKQDIEMYNAITKCADKEIDRASENLKAHRQKE